MTAHHHTILVTIVQVNVVLIVEIIHVMRERVKIFVDLVAVNLDAAYRVVVLGAHQVIVQIFVIAMVVITLVIEVVVGWPLVIFYLNDILVSY